MATENSWNGTPATIPCAIYTRKSTDDALNRDFDPVDTVAVYVRSQAGEGRVLLPDRADDGGWSDAIMDRPAQRRLHAEILERQGPAFLSLTQQFNTMPGFADSFRRAPKGSARGLAGLRSSRRQNRGTVA